MKKFKCIETGAILFVTNQFTLKQMIKSNAYQEIVEKVVSTKKTNKKQGLLIVILSFVSKKVGVV